MISRLVRILLKPLTAFSIKQNKRSQLPASKEGAVRLHVGCGAVIKPGYINVDEFNPMADVRAAIQDLRYPNESVDQIEGYMVIEHLSPQDARAFVENAYRMLKPGGRLILEVPDIEKVCRLILSMGEDTQQLEEGPFGLRGIFGEPKEAMTLGDYHKWGYTPATASKLITEAGFREFKITDGTSHCYPIRDMRVEAVK